MKRIEPPIAINNLQHIGIPVTDLTRSEVFYARLGFERVMRSPFQFEGETGNCLMMKRGEMMMELYQMPDRILRDVRLRQDGHIDHIAFDVTDVDVAFKTLKERGFDIIEEAPVFLIFWKNGCRFFNIIGPDGERLEFNQIL